jgi:putative endonuclease
LRFLLKAADLLRHKARLRRWNPDLASGRRGEDLAHRYLQSLGYRVVARNWRARCGPEVDLIAHDGDALVFIEVKSRKTDEFGSPDRAIGREKELHLLRAAREYTRRAGADWARVRFDVVNVVFSEPARIELLRDAFRS